ncbi:hypothetical protein XR65_004741 [Salmonella enterica subsp. enterica serovar Newport]|nr:hypothetical protein [Salmonella enterica subsp. enterica serovar Newport]
MFKKGNIFYTLSIAASVLLSVIAVGMWWKYFYFGTVSKNTSLWSSFGSFIGGTAGPLLSFTSIILVLRTIKITQDNHKEQIINIQKDQTYKKFTDLISLMENEFNNCWIQKLNSKTTDLEPLIKSAATFQAITMSIDITNNNLFLLSSDITQEEIKKIPYKSRKTGGLSIAISSLLKIIKKSDEEDKYLMKNIIKMKINDVDRFFIYQTLCIDQPQTAMSIKEEWSDFCEFPWKVANMVD